MPKVVKLMHLFQNYKQFNLKKHYQIKDRNFAKNQFIFLQNMFVNKKYDVFLRNSGNVANVGQGFRVVFVVPAVNGD